MKKNNDLQFNEFAPDVFSEGGELDYIERPVSAKIFLFLGIAALVFLLIVFFRIGFLSLFKGEFYSDRALANVNRERLIPAYRGVITDRYGETLARSSDTFSVFVSVGDLLRDSKKFEETILALADAGGWSEEELYVEVEKADLERVSEVAVVRNVEPERAITIKALGLDGVHVNNDFRREYVDGAVFAQVVGYTGVSETENTIVGKTGLERFYNDQLKGQDGVYTYFRNALGEVLDEKVSLEAVSGSKIVTTIDADLQRYFYNRLSQQLRSIGSRVGAGIAIEPSTGEILALVSLPSFDNNLFVTSGKSDERSALFSDPGKPLFNRAMLGSYSPGSTIKPLMALAALHEGVVDPVYGIYSPGYLEIPNPYYPDKPSRFLDWKAHGWVNVRSALARSSNVYFYAIGGGFEDLVGLGIERIKNYWRMFGFGGETGVDFVGESTGFLPDSEEKEERTGQPWRVGDTYNVSIGQGDFLVSPLQLTRFIASIADNGKMRKPHFVKEVTDVDGAKTVARWQDVSFDYSSWTQELEEVRTGMEHGVSKDYGTSHMLSTLNTTATGKTGSAQISNNTKTNAFFVGYAPAEDAQIAILVLIEDAKEGSLNAVPVARDVLNWFDINRIK